MLARTNDTHSMAFSPIIDEFWAPASPRVSLRYIESRPVVASVWGSAASTGVRPGDVILRVDGRPASERMEFFSRHIAASTAQALNLDAVNRLLRGSLGSSDGACGRGPRRDTRTLNSS